MPNYFLRVGIIFLLILLSIIHVQLTHPVQASGVDAPLILEENTSRTSQTTPDWLEPQGISIVSLVGKVSEAILQDLIIVFEPNHGIVTYQSGTRSITTVRINARVEYSDTTQVPCLGAYGNSDVWHMVVPEGSLRIFDNGVDITSQVAGTFKHYAAGLNKPSFHSGNWERYPYTTANVRFNSDGSIHMPANLGCRYTLNSIPSGEVTAEYTFTNVNSYIDVTLLYQEAHPVKSYVGPGWVGKYTGIMNQIKVRFASQLPPWLIRHEGFEFFRQLAPGETDFTQQQLLAADYFLIKFPPLADDASPLGPTSPPSGGTYRQMMSNGVTFAHSVDHTYGMLIPLHLFWQDTDQVGVTQFLPTHTFFEKRATIYNEFDEIKGPEYAVPPGMPWEQCMEDGNCPNSLLDTVFNTEFPMHVYFFDVQRVYGGLTQIPLKMAGLGYVAGREPEIVDSRARGVSAEIEDAQPALLDSMAQTMAPVSYLPFTSRALPPADAINPAIPCPCGWFDSEGRMWDFIMP